jgi:hypothetical protein
MKRRAIVLTIIVLVGASSGCKKAQSDQDAIRAGIQRHLSANSTLNMAAMDYEVKDVAITADRAQAQVEFRLKQGGATMQVTYALARVDGTWNVLKSQPAGGQIEHPPMNDVHAGSPNAPPAKGLPKIDEFFKAPPAPGTQPLPPGHPPVTTPRTVPPLKDQQTPPKTP